MVGNGGLFWCRGSVSKTDVETEKPTLKKSPRKSRANRTTKNKTQADSPTFVSHGRNHSYPIKVQEQKDSQQWVCSSQGIHHRTTQQFAQGISKLPWQSWWAEGRLGVQMEVSLHICLREVVTNDDGPWITMWHGDPNKNVFSKQKITSGE